MFVVIVIKVNACFAFSILSIACSLVSIALLTKGRSNSVNHNNYGIVPLGSLGTAISVLSFAFGVCGAVVASYGMDCECCDCSEIPNGQYIYLNDTAQISQVYWSSFITSTQSQVKGYHHSPNDCDCKQFCSYFKIILIIYGYIDWSSLTAVPGRASSFSTCATKSTYATYATYAIHAIRPTSPTYPDR